MKGKTNLRREAVEALTEGDRTPERRTAAYNDLLALMYVAEACDGEIEDSA